MIGREKRPTNLGQLMGGTGCEATERKLLLYGGPLASKGHQCNDNCIIVIIATNDVPFDANKTLEVVLKIQNNDEKIIVNITSL